MYVALSRMKSLTGLYTYNPKAITKSAHVAAEMEGTTLGQYTKIAIISLLEPFYKSTA